MNRSARLCGWMLVLAAAGCAMVGCASPGLPKPPSLNLPVVPTDVEAERAGDAVTLRFTAPTKNTDKLAVKGAMTAVLCRQVNGAGACREVLRQGVPAGKQVAVMLHDALPMELTKGDPVLLTYRVSLLNDRGRTAGPSNMAYAAGGATPEVVSGLTAAAGGGGAVLRWRAEPGSDVVELERRVTARAASPNSKAVEAGARGAKKPGTEKTANPFAAPSEPEVLNLRGGDKDAGGTVDASAKFGESYTYVAWRVRRLTLTGHAVEVRGAPSSMVAVEMRDVFPPAVPKGLTAVPAGTDAALAIDLSWEPDGEVDLAGYNVYRAVAGSGGAAERLNAAPVESPAFHDAGVRRGTRYRYAVSAVDQSGNESARSAETEEGIE